MVSNIFGFLPLPACRVVRCFVIPRLHHTMSEYSFFSNVNLRGPMKSCSSLMSSLRSAICDARLSNGTGPVGLRFAAVNGRDATASGSPCIAHHALSSDTRYSRTEDSSAARIDFRALRAKAPSGSW